MFRVRQRSSLAGSICTAVGLLCRFSNLRLAVPKEKHNFTPVDKTAKPTFIGAGFAVYENL
jgi:hypothetical protein